MIEGVVVDVIVNRRDPAKKAVTEVVADYDLGGGAIKQAIINIRSLKAKVVENAVVEEAGAEVQGDGFPAAPPALPIPATAVEVPAPPTVEVEAPRPPVPAPPTAEVEAPRSPAEVAEAPPYRPVEPGVRKHQQIQLGLRDTMWIKKFRGWMCF
jgi:hypothetical protein